MYEAKNVTWTYTGGKTEDAAIAGKLQLREGSSCRNARHSPDTFLIEKDNLH